MEYLNHRTAEKKLQSEELGQVVDQVQFLSPGVYPNHGLREKYKEIAEMMGGTNLTDERGRPNWIMTLDFFKAALTNPTKPTIKDLETLKTSAGEVNETTPSGLSKALVDFIAQLSPAEKEHQEES